MTRWLVTGAGGMLGTDMVAALTSCGAPVTGLDRAGLDVTDAAAVTDAIVGGHPDVVVNCAAWTAVDDAEASEEQALAVNAGGAANLAAACAGVGARLVQISTNYVFAGDAGRPYAEDDVPAPSTAYGRTKLAGERAVLDRLPGSGFVVRTAWLYGAHGPSFVGTMIKLEDQRPTVDVVDDQQGQPTWTADVARQIIALVHSTAAPGIYHATSGGQTTWFGLAREIFTLLGADPARVRPIPSSALSRAAPRPAYSVLGHSAWAGPRVPPIGQWRTALRRAFPELVAARRSLRADQITGRIPGSARLPPGAGYSGRPHSQRKQAAAPPGAPLRESEPRRPSGRAQVGYPPATRCRCPDQGGARRAPVPASTGSSIGR